MSAAREALMRDVRRMREAHRGDVRRYRVSYRCTTPDCGAQVITIHVLEEPGIRKFQHMELDRLAKTLLPTDPAFERRKAEIEAELRTQYGEDEDD